MKIAGREIGKPVYIVADMGASHCRRYDWAQRIIRKAKMAGADAVKIQLYEPEDMTVDAEGPRFDIPDGPWKGWNLWKLYNKAAMPLGWVSALIEYAKKIDITLFPTIYSVKRIRFAEKFNFPAYKVASFENTEEPLVKKLAETGKPLIISTGGLDYFGIVKIRRWCKKFNTIWLKCVSNYPTKAEDLNLRTILQMNRTFSRFVGLSDHSLGTIAPVIATALGVVMIEKHISLGEGFDKSFALTPERFMQMVKAVRFTEAALGSVKYDTERWLQRVDYGTTKRPRAICRETAQQECADNGRDGKSRHEVGTEAARV